MFRLKRYHIMPKPLRCLLSLFIILSCIVFMPGVNIAYAEQGGTVSGLITWQVETHNPDKISKVEFYLDGLKVSETTVNPYIYNWDTTTITNGNHVLLAKLYDLSGNLGISSIVTVNVDNAVEPGDKLPPTVSSNDPVNGTLEVPANRVISVNFSESIVEGSNFSGISLKKGSTPVSYSAVISGSKLTLTPTGLESSTGYTVTIPANAVKDAAGNGLVNAYAFSFTTAAPVPGPTTWKTPASQTPQNYDVTYVEGYGDESGPYSGVEDYFMVVAGRWYGYEDGYGEYDEEWTTLFRPDLSGFPGTADNIESAVVRIKTNFSMSPSTSTMELRKILSAWDASIAGPQAKTIIQNSTYVSDYPISGTAVAWSSVDITQMVKSWVSGEAQNNGFLIKGKTGTTLGIAMYPLNDGTEANRPYIEITYRQTAPEYITVTKTDPVNGALEVPVNKAITVDFSENIVRGSNFSGINLKKGSTPVSYSASTSGSKLTITPTGLESSTVYTVTIPANAVKDAAGNGLENAYAFSFTTAAPAPGPTTWKTPTTGQDEQSYDGVLVTGDSAYTGFYNYHLSLVGHKEYFDDEEYGEWFSEDLTSLERFDLSGFSGGNIVSANLVLRTDSNLYDPSGSITAEIRSINSPWTMTSSEGDVQDIINNSSYIGDMNISEVRGTLNRIDITETVKDWVKGTHPNYGLVLSSNSSDFGAIGSFNHPDEAYRPYIEIVYKVDSESPTVTTTDPVDGATKVPINKVLTVNFSENIVQGSNFSGISLKKGSTPVSYSTSISGSTLTITPSGLDSGTAYSVTIPANAVKDAAGNGLANDYTFNFTTKAPLITATWKTPITGQDDRSYDGVLVTGDSAYTGFYNYHLSLVGHKEYFDDEEYGEWFSEDLTSLERFDLSGFSGGNIVSANLVLRTDSNLYDPSGSITAEIRSINSPWTMTSSEGDVQDIINNSSYIGDMNISEVRGTLNRIDITEAVKDWVEGTQPNYGLVLSSDSSDFGAIGSFNHPDEAYRPYIEIVYEEE